MRDCDSIGKLISEYLENSLDESASNAVSEHIDNCEACRKEYLFEKSIRENCRQIENVELPGDFCDRLHSGLMDAVKDIQKEESKKRIFNIDRKWIGVFSSIAAGIIIFVAVGGMTGRLFDGVFKLPEDMDKEYGVCEKPDGTQEMTAKNKSDSDLQAGTENGRLMAASQPLSPEEQERQKNAPRGMGGMDQAATDNVIGSEALRNSDITEEPLYSIAMNGAEAEDTQMYIERDSHVLIETNDPQTAEAKVRNIIERIGASISDEQIVVPRKGMDIFIAGYESNDARKDIVAVLPYDKYQLLTEELSSMFPGFVNNGLNERDLTSYVKEREEELARNSERIDELENKRVNMQPNTDVMQLILNEIEELSTENNKISSWLDTVKSSSGKVHVVITIEPR